MTPADGLIFLAKAAAKGAGLDPALVCAVVEQESSWDPWAIRYEPDFYTRYILPLQEKGIVRTDTEARARAFSWGLMQLMGEVARELGYSGNMAALCAPSTGLHWGCTHLAKKFTEAGGDQTKALQLWNGGGNPAYAAEVIARVKNYT